MAVYFSPVGNGFQWLTQAGLPLSGGKIYTYAAGTTTPTATYTDNTGGTPNANPIILDSTGRYAQEIWLTGGQSYKFVVTDSSGVTQFTLDNLLANDSSVVNYTPPGAGGVPTTVASVLSRTVYAANYAIDPTGVTDSTAGVQNAINEAVALGGGTVVFPPGTFLITSLSNITTGIRLKGAGNAWFAYNAYQVGTGTILKFNGVSGSTFITFNLCNGGFGVEDLTLDLNNLAGGGIYINSCTGGYFKSVGVINPVAGVSNYCIKLNGTVVNSTCSWNTFVDLELQAYNNVKAALWLSGTNGAGNACHCTFINSRIGFGGSSHGIYLGACDNINFLMTFIFANPTPTGYGVYVDPTEMTGFPSNNSFFHLEASTRGWYQPGGLSSYIPGRIYGYMQDNGQPNPIVTSGSLDALDIIYPITVAAGTGWSGGSPTFTANWTKAGRVITVTIFFTGTAVVAAANATITGLPNNPASYSLGVVNGVNTGGSGAQLCGYVSGTTLTILSGITSTSGATLIATYLV